MKLHISLTFICDAQVRFEQNAQVLDQFSFTATLGALSVGLIMEPAVLVVVTAWWLLRPLVEWTGAMKLLLYWMRQNR